jgi:hypothetical protein
LFIILFFLYSYGEIVAAIFSLTRVPKLPWKATAYNEDEYPGPPPVKLLKNVAGRIIDGAFLCPSHQSRQSSEPSSLKLGVTYFVTEASLTAVL